MRDAAREPWWKIIGTIALPWVVIGYVWWVGFHWTVIGLAGVYAVALLLAVGVAIGEERKS